MIAPAFIATIKKIKFLDKQRSGCYLSLRRGLTREKH